MNYEELANQLLFSREAAEYLGITVQRLNKLVQDEKIKPLKERIRYGFHISELNKRKEELSIFLDSNSGGGKGMFEIDNQTKQEAVNFATLMSILNYTESKLEPLFDSFAKTVDITQPIDKGNIYLKYAEFLKLMLTNYLMNTNPRIKLLQIYIQRMKL